MADSIDFLEKRKKIHTRILDKNSIAKTTPTIVFANEDIRSTLTKLVFIFPTNKKS